MCSSSCIMQCACFQQSNSVVHNVAYGCAVRCPVWLHGHGVAWMPTKLPGCAVIFVSVAACCPFRCCSVNYTAPPKPKHPHPPQQALTRRLLLAVLALSCLSTSLAAALLCRLHTSKPHSPASSSTAPAQPKARPTTAPREDRGLDLTTEELCSNSDGSSSSDNSSSSSDGSSVKVECNVLPWLRVEVPSAVCGGVANMGSSDAPVRQSASGLQNDKWLCSQIPELRFTTLCSCS